MWYYHIKKMKDKNYMILSIGRQKAYNKIQYSYTLKTEQIRHRKKTAQNNKGHVQ